MQIINRIGNLIKACKQTRNYTLIYVGANNNKYKDNTILTWILDCICHTSKCTCTIKLNPNYICTLGTLGNSFENTYIKTSN